MALPPQPDTPVGKNRRRQAVNLRASAEHAISDRAIEHKEMNSYIDLARSSFGESNWTAIVGDASKDIKGNLNVLESHNRLVELVKKARKIYQKPKGRFLENVFYGPTIQLCNRISLAVFDSIKDPRSPVGRQRACIFTTQAGHEPKGDILKLEYTPDYCSFSGTREELERAAAAPNYARSICWPEMDMVGEQKKWHENGKGQFKSYLSTLKRYRADIPTVHGFRVHRGKIQLSQLNASGMWSSSTVDTETLDAWTAFVVLLYQSYQHHDQKLVYNAQQTEFLRWDFVDGPRQTPLVLAPFYAAQAPGRVTFASFEVISGDVALPNAAEAFYGPEVKGFWKTSWQQEGRSKERELLDHLHAEDRWLPGLVRPYPEMHGDRLRVPTAGDMVRRADDREAAEVEAQVPVVAEDVDANAASAACTGESTPSSGSNSTYTLNDEDDDDYDDASCDNNGKDHNEVDEDEDLGEFATFLFSMPASPPDFVERIQEIVRLASIGEPLSQCESPRQLLFCAYDLLETHIHMWEEGVLHRDVSWFNVLCNPKHYIGDEADAKVRPCIKKILHLLGQEDAALPEVTEEVDLMPSILLTDLDHAIAKEQLETAGPPDGRERTGTAMFISGELSNHSTFKYSGLPNTIWATLCKVMNYVEEHDLGSAALARAFPDADGHHLFMDRFNQVKALEAVRSESAKLKERPVHSPRHDAESIYWVFLWAFARARPRAAAQEQIDSERVENLTNFAQSLLDHTVGREGQRINYLNPAKLDDLFHPSLAGFEELFIAMAAYLAVPWHLYGNLVQDDHVHVAFRRMILGYVLRTDPQLLDLRLDTERPRRVDVTKGLTTERMTPAWSESLSAVGGSGRASFQDPLPKIPEKKATPDGTDAGAAGADLPSPSSLVTSGTSNARDGPTESQSSNASNKRKASDPRREPVSERPRTGKSGKNMSLAARARQASHYDHALHFRDRSAHALRLKSWKDRMYWFAKGY